MPLETPKERFELVLTVRPQDIDLMEHVNNVVYLRWVQEVAIAHWTAAATPEQVEALGWVVARHEIDYKHPARLEDVILVRTWVGVSRKHLFERHTEILRQRDLKVLARARSLWCPIDLQTGRVTRVSADVRERFSVPATDESPSA